MTLLSNTIYQLLGKILTVVAALIGIKLISNTYGPDIFGRYFTAISYLTLFFTVSDWGINQIVVRKYIDEQRISKSHFTKVVFSRLMIAIFLAVVAIVILSLFGFSKDVLRAVVVGLPIILGFSMWSTASIIFQAKLKYQYDFLSKLAYSIITLGLLHFVITIHGGLNLLILTNVFGWMGSGVLALYFAREYIDYKEFKFDLEFIKILVVSSLPIGVSLVANTVLAQADKLIIPLLINYEKSGFYAISYKIFEFGIIIPTFIINAVFPFLIAKKDKVFHETLTILLFISIPLTVATMIFAPDIIVLISSEKFIGGVMALRVLALSFVMFFMTALLRYQVIVEKNEIKFLYIYISTMFLNIFLNLLLLPVWGIVGASVATIVAEGLVLVFFIRETKIKILNKDLIDFTNKVILVTLLAFVPILILALTFVQQLMASIAIFIVLSYGFGVLSNVLKILKGFSNLPLQSQH